MFWRKRPTGPLEIEVMNMERYWLNSQAGSLTPAQPGGQEAGNGGGLLVALLTLEEFKELEGLSIHKKNLVRSMGAVRYCKAERFHDCLQGTMRVPRNGIRRQKNLVFGFYLDESRLLLIGEGGELRGTVEKIRDDVPAGCSLNEFFLLLLNELIEDDVLYLQKLEERLEQVEEEVLKKAPEHFDKLLLDYRKRLSESRAYYGQLANIGDYMQINPGEEQRAGAGMGWELFTHRTERLHDYVETMREYLQQIRELYQTQIDIEQNRVMTFLTVVTTLFLPLSLIAGWYGMNFPHMPELRWRYGYPAVIVLSVLVVLAEIRYFKKKRML